MSDWKTGEEELRRREVTSQSRLSRAQAIGTFLSFFAIVAAAIAAFQAGRAVDVSKDTIARQADENRLTVAMQAIGNERPAARIAGLAILRRHVKDRISRARDAGRSVDLNDALNLYDTTSIIFQNYLRETASSITKTNLTAGYGKPQVPSDTVYAANELKNMLDMRSLVDRQVSSSPGVDLSNVVLYTQPWRNIDFSWVANYSESLDLRGATLTNSQWGQSWLRGSYLQCANLAGAKFGGDTPGKRQATLASVDFRGADLRGARLNADLSGAKLAGANLDGTDFSGANLNGVSFRGVANYGRAKGLKPGIMGFSEPDPGTLATAYVEDTQACLNNREYWDHPEVTNGR